MVGSAVGTAVTPLGAQLTSIEGILSGADQRSTLIALASLQQRPNPPIVTVTTDTGVTGQNSRGILLGASGGSASEVQVNYSMPGRTR